MKPEPTIEPETAVRSTGLVSDPVTELLQIIKESGATLRFWMCPERGHRGVTWSKGVATCNECGHKSDTKKVS